MHRNAKVKRGKRILFIILSTALGMGAFVPLLVNLALAGRFTWSLIPLGATLMTWLMLAPFFILSRQRAIISWLAAVLTLPVFLWLVDSLVPAKAWFLPLGLPAAALGLAAWGAIVWIWRYSRIRFWYALSLTSLVIALVCVPLFFVVRPYLPQPDPLERERYLVFLCLCGTTVVLSLVAWLVHKLKIRRDRS